MNQASGTKASAPSKKFGFLVHPRGMEDFLRKFPYLRFLPRKVLDFLTMNMPPVVVSKVTGLKDAAGNDIKGEIVAITMTARQMMEHREKALKQIRRATLFAEKRGIGIIGFGALTASFSKGGLDLMDDIESIGITTGRAYTTKTVTDYVKMCVEKFGFDRAKVRLAVVGAGGSIGGSCAKLLASWGVRNMLFVDLPKRAEHLKERVEHLRGLHGEMNVSISHAIGDIKTYDIIIAATNAPEALIRSDDLAPGAIVINDAQPSDISPEVVRERDDVLIIEGGVISTPGIRGNFNMGLAGREETFCCLGEVLVLAYHNKFEHYALGELDIDLIHKIEKMAEPLGFSIARMQNSIQRYIPDEQIERVRQIIAKKLSAESSA